MCVPPDADSRLAERSTKNENCFYKTDSDPELTDLQTVWDTSLALSFFLSPSLPLCLAKLIMKLTGNKRRKSSKERPRTQKPTPAPMPRSGLSCVLSQLAIMSRFASERIVDTHTQTYTHKIKVRKHSESSIVSCERVCVILTFNVTFEIPRIPERHVHRF